MVKKYVIILLLLAACTQHPERINIGPVEPGDTATFFAQIRKYRKEISGAEVINVYKIHRVYNLACKADTDHSLWHDTHDGPCPHMTAAHGTMILEFGNNGRLPRYTYRYDSTRGWVELKPSIEFNPNTCKDE